MPREARLKSESGIYHVMLRGINRQTIFEDNEDCEKYLQCIKDCKEISGFILYAYCLMGNHVHLLIKEMKEPLEQIFKRLGSRYVYWYNWRHKRCGHLFQDRFKSEPIKDDDRQFVAALRYIYMNPVKAKICGKPEEYRWSSYLNKALTDNDCIDEIITADQLHILMKETGDEQFLELSDDNRLTDNEASELIKEISGAYDSNAFQNLASEKLKEYISILHNKGCSIRQLVRITGLTKSKIERILK